MSEKRKKSWKEIDAQKDRSQHRRPEPTQGGPGPRGRDPSKSYRAALDHLFASGGVSGLVRRRDEETGVTVVEEDAPKRKALAGALESATGAKDRQAALEAFRSAFGLPRDFELLAHFLEHEDPDVVEETLSRIGALLEEEKPRRARTLVAKLKAVAELSEWGKLRKAATALLEKL